MASPFFTLSCYIVRTGSGLVVLDADGADAIEFVERLLARTDVDAQPVPRVETQRGKNTFTLARPRGR
jgi:hypothetical protein